MPGNVATMLGDKVILVPSPMGDFFDDGPAGHNSLIALIKPHQWDRVNQTDVTPLIIRAFHDEPILHQMFNR